MRFNWGICIRLFLLLFLSPSMVLAHNANETDSGAHARVGELALFEGKFQDLGKGSFEIRFTAVRLEDATPILSLNSRSSDGTYKFGVQFFDGTPHEVTIQAINATQGTVLSEKKIIVDVEALDPPAVVKIKTMLFLLAVVAAGMLMGAGINYMSKVKNGWKGGDFRAASL